MSLSDVSVAAASPLEEVSEQRNVYLVEPPAIEGVVNAMGVLSAAGIPDVAAGRVGRIFTHVLRGVEVELTSAEAEAARSSGARVTAAAPLKIAGNSQSSPPWHLVDVDASEGANFVYPTNPGSGVPIYVVDTPVTVTHTEFAGRARHAPEGQYGCSPDDGFGWGSNHGTSVASLAAGRTLGLAKESPVVSVHVADCFGWGTHVDLVAALEQIYAIHPAGTPGVVNMSVDLGCWLDVCDPVETALGALRARGLVLVAAAGNEAGNACASFPASSAHVISVAASTQQRTLASFSNRGRCVDIIAPGDNVAVAKSQTTTSFGVDSGTSFAAPLVAGAVAVAWGAEPNLSVDAITERVLEEATQGSVSGVPSGTPNLLLRLDADQWSRGAQRGLAPHATVSPKSCGYTDGWAIPGWARQGSCWAKNTGVVTPSFFSAERTATRAEIATMLWRAAGRPSAANHRFADEAQIPSWARSATDWMYQQGITKNDPFRPNDLLSRAEMLTFLSRAGYQQPNVGYFGPRLGFVDARDIPSWAFTAANWAYPDRVTTHDTLRPRQAIIRAEVVAMLWRASGSP